MIVFICEIQKQNKLMKKKNHASCSWFLEAENWWEEIQNGGCQNVQTSSYKINKYKTGNVQQKLIYHNSK